MVLLHAPAITNLKKATSKAPGALRKSGNRFL